MAPPRSAPQGLRLKYEFARHAGNLRARGSAPRHDDVRSTCEMMVIRPAEFRRVLGHWATGVTITATVTPDGEPRGLTASAVASVSLDPPLVLVCVEHGADTYSALRAAGIFSINFLSSEMEPVSRRFAEGDASGKFHDVPYRRGSTGAPILEGALAWVECRVHAVHESGDHTIFIGEVVDSGVGGGEPLLYYRGRYGRLAQ